MSYTTIPDFIALDLGNLITSGENIPADFDLDDLFARCLGAGLIEESEQGYDWVADEYGEMDEAHFWDIVTEMLDN